MVDSEQYRDPKGTTTGGRFSSGDPTVPAEGAKARRILDKTTPPNDPDAQDGLMFYQVGPYQEINRVHRDYNGNVDAWLADDKADHHRIGPSSVPRFKEGIARLRDLMVKAPLLPAPIVAFRSVPFAPNVKEGDEFVDNGFTSLTTDEKQATRWGTGLNRVYQRRSELGRSPTPTPTLFRVHLPKGTPVVWTNKVTAPVEQMVFVKNELLVHKRRFRVRKVSPGLIDLEIVG